MMGEKRKIALYVVNDYVVELKFKKTIDSRISPWNAWIIKKKSYDCELMICDITASTIEGISRFITGVQFPIIVLLSPGLKADYKGKDRFQHGESYAVLPVWENEEYSKFVRYISKKDTEKLDLSVYKSELKQMLYRQVNAPEDYF